MANGATVRREIVWNLNPTHTTEPIERYAGMTHVWTAGEHALGQHAWKHAEDMPLLAPPHPKKCKPATKTHGRLRTVGHLSTHILF